ncbi:MAG: redox-regulated ATPase YchF [Candidatus Aenigmarchaeota archaeon]|nr:redox-regulated ATPase YchF [Candidatus Aenigmarchaeota archaeon]
MIALVGKPSSGKSSFFKALTKMDVKIASYPFTTIEPNHGVAFVKTKCPHNEIGKKCDPNNSGCVNGTRLIPVKILDVAGLVPGAHAGRGRGNKFLDDLRQADALIHIVDMSGKTDENGLPADNHDPLTDINWLRDEVELWVKGIIEKVWSKSDDAAIVKQLTGFTPKNEIISQCIKDAEKDLRTLARLICERTKPMLIAANKMDIPEAAKNFNRIAEIYKDEIVPCSAELEIVLNLASSKGLVKYENGGLLISDNANGQQRNALEKAKEFIKSYGSTGVEKCVERAVFSLLNFIEVYPVENENTWADSRGRVLPDVYLVHAGTTAKELASVVHTDLAKNFIAAIDARKKMRVRDDYVLKKGDVIKIVAGK